MGSRCMGDACFRGLGISGKSRHTRYVSWTALCSEISPQKGRLLPTNQHAFLLAEGMGHRACLAVMPNSDLLITSTNHNSDLLITPTNHPSFLYPPFLPHPHMFCSRCRHVSTSLATCSTAPSAPGGGATAWPPHPSTGSRAAAGKRTWVVSCSFIITTSKLWSVSCTADRQTYRVVAKIPGDRGLPSTEAGHLKCARSEHPDRGSQTGQPQACTERIGLLAHPQPPTPCTLCPY